ncbi:hypothetical protein ACHAWF_015001, partial [Thalassiosira exigua]
MKGECASKAKVARRHGYSNSHLDRRLIRPRKLNGRHWQPSQRVVSEDEEARYIMRYHLQYWKAFG